jgi:hypothetical protein
MIQQGVDGLSRGEESRLATYGMSLGGMVPLHLSAAAWSAMLEDCIHGWADTGRQLEVLEPRGWFTSAHQLGSVGWFPAPAAADAAIDQFCDVLHKRPNCVHVFAISLLMMNIWRKQLLKATDVYFVSKAESMIWNNSQHEPLFIFISLPLSRHEPWCLRRTKPVVDMESALRELPPDNFLQNWNILRKFLGFTRQLEIMPEGLVRELLHTPGIASRIASHKMRKAICWLVRKTSVVLERQDREIIFFAPFNVNFVISGTFKEGLPWSGRGF